MHIVDTERLRLRQLTLDDAGFMLTLLNDPAWLRNIGDRGVRNLADARAYLATGPLELYARLGFGFYAVERLADAALIGICGLIKRDTLPDVDIGYALLPEYVGQGYALEAARASVELARERFGLKRLVAITTPANEASARLLMRLGMTLEKHIQHGPQNETLCLYAMPL